MCIDKDYDLVDEDDDFIGSGDGEKGSGENDKDNCIDGHANCEGWAAMEECDAHSRYMLTSCQKSCVSCNGWLNVMLL